MWILANLPPTFSSPITHYSLSPQRGAVPHTEWLPLAHLRDFDEMAPEYDDVYEVMKYSCKWKMGQSKNGYHLVMSSYLTKGNNPLCWYRQNWSWLCCLYSEDKVLWALKWHQAEPRPTNMT